MKTSAANKAYFNAENEERRETHKQMCLSGLMGRKMTIRELSERIGLTYNQTQKRVSELLAEKRVLEFGEKIEGDNANTIFCINPEPLLLPEIVPTFTAWCKKNRPEVYRDYEVLILHKL